MKPVRITSYERYSFLEMSLPLEFWEMILKLLFDEDKLFCRLVCKDWLGLITHRKTLVSYWHLSPSQVKYLINIGFTRYLQRSVEGGNTEVLSILDGHVVWKPRTLCRAANSGNIEMYKALEARLGDVGFHWRDQAWYWAITTGKFEIVKYLYPSRQVSVVDMELACCSLNVELVEWLHLRNIEFNYTCLSFAIGEWDIETIKYILRNSNVYCREAFFRAVESDHPKIIEMLSLKEDRSTWTTHDYDRIRCVLEDQHHLCEKTIAVLFRGGFITRGIAKRLFERGGDEKNLDWIRGEIEMYGVWVV